jgi:hypothetical protein
MPLPVEARVLRVPAGEVEAAVIAQLRRLLCSPEVIVATWRTARKELPDLTEAEVRDAILRFAALWEELFPAEQAQIVHLLVERVTVTATGLDIRLRVEGLSSFIGELRAGTSEEAAAWWRGVAMWLRAKKRGARKAIGRVRRRAWLCGVNTERVEWRRLQAP